MDPEKNVLRITHGLGSNALYRFEPLGPQAAPKGALDAFLLYPTLTDGANNNATRWVS